MSQERDPLGVDILAVDDLDPHFTIVWGAQNLQAALLRRITSTGGCLTAIGGNADYGYSIPDQLNNDVTPAAMAGITSAIQGELAKDPRVNFSDPSIVLSGGKEMRMDVSVTGESTAGPFSFVASVGDVSVEFLNAGAPQISPTLGSAAGLTQVTIISQTGPQGERGPSGSGGGGGAGALVAPSFAGMFASDTTVEQLVAESAGNFVPGGATLTVSLVCFAKMPSGGTGTVAVRIGGTEGAVDGTVVVSASVTSTSSYQAISASATCANPGGVKPVKLTLQSSVDGDDCIAKGVEVTIS